MAKRVAVLVVAGVVGALFHAGCGGASVDGICQMACDCQTSCKNNQLQDCETSGAEQQQIAEKAGCGSLFDDELACLGGLTCKNHELPNTPCQTEILAVENCVGKPTPGGPSPG